jgi:sortase (surface protein transpeptidase)
MPSDRGPLGPSSALTFARPALARSATFFVLAGLAGAAIGGSIALGTHVGVTPLLIALAAFAVGMCARWWPHREAAEIHIPTVLPALPASIVASSRRRSRVARGAVLAAITLGVWSLITAVPQGREAQASVHLTPAPGHGFAADPVLPVPAPVIAAGVTLQSGPVPVPLRLELPSIGLDAAVLGVGITPADVMDAPTGPASDPVWQEAFWYRGSAIPGASSTAVIAGHIDDSLGRPGVFARLNSLQVGDPIVVHDSRDGLDVRFAVVATDTYALNQSDPGVLAQVYGSGPIAGVAPQPSTDGLAHLTLITCAGTFDYAARTHDQRFVVYAIRVS